MQQSWPQEAKLESEIHTMPVMTDKG